MEPSELIRTLWDRIDARDWPGVAGLLAADIEVYWPASGELIAGRTHDKMSAACKGSWVGGAQMLGCQGGLGVRELSACHSRMKE